jgi:hypothetical protein
MNDEEKAFDMENLATFCDVLKSSEQERKEMLEGGSILLDLGWPSNYIVNTRICRRAIQGLVPRYEGFSSLADYEKRWWSEDHK